MKIAAINNAWRIRDDWDYLITPDDFPAERMPASVSKQQALITSSDYVPANNRFGGVFYAGGTMAFSAGYWALAALRPETMAFLGCDMVYGKTNQTHFYGDGAPDPLRTDPSLRNLEAKSARLMMHARRLGCACVRLSSGESRLVFPTAHFDEIVEWTDTTPGVPDQAFDQIKVQEDRLGYVVPSGRYWEATDPFDIERIDEIDEMWLRAVKPR